MTQKEFNRVVELHKEKTELERVLDELKDQGHYRLCALDKTSWQYSPIGKESFDNIVNQKLSAIKEDVKIRLKAVNDEIEKL